MFGWLKKILGKNSTNEQSNEVSTIDTSFIRVPKLSQLDDEAREIVLESFNSLSYDSYKSLVKFADDSIKQVNYERELLYRTLTRYQDIYEYRKNRHYKKQEKTFMDYQFAKISVADYKCIVSRIIDVRKELELKLIALEMFIKKESRRKYDFLGIAGKAERLRYLADKDKLSNARQRILIAIKTNELVLRAVLIDLKANNALQECGDTRAFDHKVVCDTLRNTLNELDRKLAFTIRNEFMEDIKAYAKKMIGKTYTIHSSFVYEDGKVVLITKKMVDEVLWSVHHDWMRFVNMIPEGMHEELYEIIGRAYHNRDLYTLEHFRDYEKYLKEMDELIEKYEAIPILEWNGEELYEKLEYYNYEIRCYLTLFADKTGESYPYFFSEPYDDKLDHNTFEKLKDRFLKLLFFNYLINGEKVVIDEYHFSYFSGSYDHIDERYMEMIKPYFVRFSKELLQKVESKYHVSFFVQDEYIHKNTDMALVLYDLIQKEYGNISEFYKQYGASKPCIPPCKSTLVEEVSPVYEEPAVLRLVR